MSEAKPLSPILGQIEGTNQQLYNWHGKAFLVGPGHSTSILDEIQHRRKVTKQNFILISGEAGNGKSYFGIRLAQIFDSHFVPEIQICFDQSQLLYLIGEDSPLKRGQVLIIDEAQFAAGARQWMTEAQRILMQHIEAVRSKGLIICVIGLHASVLDKIVRSFVLSMQMNMTERGQADVYKLWYPAFADKQFKKKLGELCLQLPDIEKCGFSNCLICKFQDKCMTQRARYERMKKSFLGRMNAQSVAKAQSKERKKQELNFDQIFRIIDDSKDSLVLTHRSWGKAEVESIKLILEDKGIKLDDAQARRVLKRGVIRFPDIFNKQKELKKVSEQNE